MSFEAKGREIPENQQLERGLLAEIYICLPKFS